MELALIIVLFFILFGGLYGCGGPPGHGWYGNGTSRPASRKPDRR